MFLPFVLFCMYVPGEAVSGPGGIFCWMQSFVSWIWFARLSVAKL